jgi:hypothetical protein
MSRPQMETRRYLHASFSTTQRLSNVYSRSIFCKAHTEVVQSTIFVLDSRLTAGLVLYRRVVLSGR